ncbi:MAG: DUF1697 domain-containing protein, partial [Desulfovibrionales bacterium]|nr:DUF1697 domain-containing protein [Desulfovibrionales bacterium]
GDSAAGHKKTVARQFLLMQLGHCSNVRTYIVFKQESGDTDEHKVSFRQVEGVALLIEQEFAKQFGKPTRLEMYREVLRRESPNKASDATSEPAPGAVPSSHQR